MPNIITSGAASAKALGFGLIGANPNVTTLMIQAGGGGGGFTRGGGGGGGGNVYYSALTIVPGTTYTIAVGTGGAGSSSGANKGSNGNASSFIGGALSISATGGGGGGSTTNTQGASGGSGGGSCDTTIASFTASISGTLMTVTAVTSGTINAGDYLDTNSTGNSYNPNIIVEGTYIVSQASGTAGGIGTYNLSTANTFSSAAIQTTYSGGAATAGQGNKGGNGAYTATTASGGGGGGASSVGGRGFRGLWGHYSNGGAGLVNGIHPSYYGFGGGGGGGGYGTGITAAGFGYGGPGGGGRGGAAGNGSWAGGTASQSGTTLTVTAVTSGTFTASIAGTTLTVTAQVGAPNYPIIGATVTGTGVASGTVITGLLTGNGTGGTCTYSLNKSSTVASSTLTLSWGGFITGSSFSGLSITAEKVVSQLTSTSTAILSTTATGTSGANYITVASTTGLVVGMFAQPISGVPVNTFINAINGTTLELTNALTGNLSASAINFYAPGMTGTYTMSVSQTQSSQVLTVGPTVADNGYNALIYTGGGGGGSGGNSGAGVNTAGNGATGCVIISYPTTFKQPTTTGSPTVTTNGANTVYLFTGAGTITW